MEITIQPLSPGLAETFAAFFSGIDFSGTPHWASCFCRYYYLYCSMEEWRARTLESNRAEAIAAIQSGEMQGYLAFSGETCIGWCSANDLQNFPRLAEDMRPCSGQKRVGCTICFVIHPDWRGTGVARTLLQRAIEDYTSRGYDAMLALPFESKEFPQKRYRGTPSMYLEAGYRVLDERDGIQVMWLDLSRTQPVG